MVRPCQWNRSLRAAHRRRVTPSAYNIRGFTEQVSLKAAMTVAVEEKQRLPLPPMLRPLRQTADSPVKTNASAPSATPHRNQQTINYPPAKSPPDNDDLTFTNHRRAASRNPPPSQPPPPPKPGQPRPPKLRSTPGTQHTIREEHQISTNATHRRENKFPRQKIIARKKQRPPPAPPVLGRAFNYKLQRHNGHDERRGGPASDDRHSRPVDLFAARWAIKH